MSRHHTLPAGAATCHWGFFDAALEPVLTVSSGGIVFGVGVGSLILLLNITLLTLYTLSCHSLRHLAGGKLDCFSCTAFGPSRHTAWSWLTGLNSRHMLFAWASLIAVGLTDLYIRLVSAGLLKDIRIL